MDLFVVYDTKGSGRVAGVFDDRSRAEDLVRINPYYFKLRPSVLNSVNAEIVRWSLNDREREQLTALVGHV